MFSNNATFSKNAGLVNMLSADMNYKQNTGFCSCW